MRYFKDKNGEVFGYETATQQHLIDAAIKKRMTEVTSSWPPPPPTPTFAERNATILAQIAALDMKRIRPLAEGDTAYLTTLNDKIFALRATLK